MKYEQLENGNLKISLENDDDAEELQTMIDRASNLDHGVLADILEYTGWQGNSELLQVQPEDIGALTDAPILTDDMTYTDGDTDKREVVGQVWWYPEYAVYSFAKVLLEEKEVIFTLAPSDEPTATAGEVAATAE